MKEIIEFVSSSIVEGVVGDIVYDSLKAILGSSFDILSRYIKNNEDREFKGALKMLLEQNSQLKEEIEKLIQESRYKNRENKAPIFQEHFGNGHNIGGNNVQGDIVGRDKVVHNHPK